jgi:hypothetical protein
MSADPPDPPGNRLQLIEWRPLRQNTLMGFVTVRIEPPGLVIHHITVHRNGDSVWVGLPGKPQIDKDGRVLTDERGRRKYVPVVEVPDGAVRERLSAAIIALVKARDPQGLA